MYSDEFATCEAITDTREKPEVQALIERRNRFLSANPQLRSVQDEIDRLMRTTIDPAIRLEILFMLISEKLTEMKQVFGEVLNLAETALSKS